MKVNSDVRTYVEVNTSDLDRAINALFPMTNFCSEADSEMHRDEVRTIGFVSRTSFDESSNVDKREFLQYISGCLPTAIYMMSIMLSYLVYVGFLEQGEILVRND